MLKYKLFLINLFIFGVISLLFIFLLITKFWKLSACITITFLSLKRDAWSNNIDIITDKTIEDRNNIIRSHRPRWYTDGGLFYPYYYITGDVKNVNKLSTVSFLFPNGSSSYVVWLGFRVSGDAYYGTVNAEGTQATGIPAHGLGNKFDAIAPVFYTPIAILNGFTDGIPNYIFNFTTW